MSDSYTRTDGLVAACIGALLPVAQAAILGVGRSGIPESFRGWSWALFALWQVVSPWALAPPGMVLLSWLLVRSGRSSLSAINIGLRAYLLGGLGGLLIALPAAKAWKGLYWLDGGVSPFTFGFLGGSLALVAFAAWRRRQWLPSPRAVAYAVLALSCCATLAVNRALKIEAKPSVYAISVPADHLICPIHDVRLKLTMVHVSYGYPLLPHGYDQARKEGFPYANWTYHEGCEPTDLSQAEMMVCDQCRDAERRYFRDLQDSGRWPPPSPRQKVPRKAG